MEIYAGTIHADYCEGSDECTLTAPFRVSVDGTVITIPAGFVWDGASLPRAAYATFGTPFDKVHRKPSCLHDAIYRGAVAGFSRAEADAIYRDFLVECGLGRVKAWIEWAAVRLFGGKNYRKG